MIHKKCIGTEHIVCGDIIYARARNRELFLLSKEDQDLLNFRWRVDRNGYVVRSTSKPSTIFRNQKTGFWKGAVQKLHRVIGERAGLDPDEIFDHKNRLRLDNRRNNLREASPQLNAVNRTINRTNTSGHIGICKVSESGRKQKYLVRCGKLSARTYTLDEALQLRKDFEEHYGI